jgi:hypothetical protein
LLDTVDPVVDNGVVDGLVDGRIDGGIKDVVIVGGGLVDARLAVTLLSGTKFCEAASVNSW